MSPWEETIEQISRRGWPNGYGLNREGFDGGVGGTILCSAGSHWDGQSLEAFLFWWSCLYWNATTGIESNTPTKDP